MKAKELAAQKAVGYIRNGMCIGLGTGTTSLHSIEAIGKMIKDGLSIKAVASSKASEDIARNAGVSISPFSEINKIDLYIDGADEVDKHFNLIKGGGGALLREKILAFHSKKFLVIVDSSKLVDTLGGFPLPVEIISFAAELTLKSLESLSCTAQIRKKNNETFKSDNGNLIADCLFGKIPDPDKLAKQIDKIPGVVEVGLFSKKLVNRIIVGYNDGRVEVLQ
jgi:ribose 5-phosphate isomerase A